MKKIIFVLSLTVLVFAANAQDEKKDEKKELGFKKENLFTGGNLEASFFNGTTLLGLSPYFGYSLNKFVDVAASFNFNYTSTRDYLEYGDKLRQTVYGPGAFVRLFPINFLFAQAQYEHNFINNNYIPVNGSTQYVPFRSSTDANSFLIGGGYCSGRGYGSNTYFYLSILWDVSGNRQSPYVDGLGRSVPIIRAGFNIALFQGRRGR